MATLFTLPDRTAFNSNGLPSPGAKAYFYLTGTTTLTDVYTTSALTTAHANPVVADSAGRLPPIYMDPNVSYKLVLTDKNDVAIGSTIDPLGPYASYTSLASLEAVTGQSVGDLAYLTATGRSGLFKWSASDLSTEVTADTEQGIYIAPSSDATGASGAWVRIYDGPVNVLWFGATADGSTNDSSFFTAAAAVAGADGSIYIPGDRTYRVENVAPLAGQTWFSDGYAILKAIDGATSSNVLLEVVVDGFTARGLVFDGNVAASGGVDSFNNVITQFQADNISYLDCHWQNTQGISLLVSGGDDMLVDAACSFTNCGRKNQFSANTADRRDAIALTGTTTTIRRPRIFARFNGVGLDFVSLAGSTNKIYDPRVSITAFDNDNGGIYVSNCRGGSIYNNTIREAAGNAIDIINTEGLTVSGNNCRENGAAGIGILSGCKNITVVGNACSNNWQDGTSIHRGGITFEVNGSNTIEDINVSGNRCWDDQGAGNVTQRYAIGVVQQDTGTFSRINVTADNMLTGYDGSGNSSSDTTFQAPGVLGLLGFPQIINLDDDEEIVLYTASEVAGQIMLRNINNGHWATFAMREDNSPVELLDTGGTWVNTDTDTNNCIYRNSGDNTIRLKNRLGLTRAYEFWMIGPGYLGV